MNNDVIYISLYKRTVRSEHSIDLSLDVGRGVFISYNYNIKRLLALVGNNY